MFMAALSRMARQDGNHPFLRTAPASAQPAIGGLRGNSCGGAA
jgi:hypothetical protein